MDSKLFNYGLSRTPPENATLFPPSPPRTDERPSRQTAVSSVPELVQRVNAHVVAVAEHTTDQNFTISVSPKLDPRLLDDIETNPRWICRKEDLVTFRMPSAVHEVIACGVQAIILDQLRGKPVVSRGSASIKLSGCNTAAQQPDFQYIHNDATVPSVVGEIAYSQDTKDAVKQIKRYMHGTFGEVGTCVLIAAKPLPEASILSCWRSKLVESSDDMADLVIEEVFHKEFRSSTGSKANQNATLMIPFGDFGIKEAPGDQGNVKISCRELFDLLVLAEEGQKRTREEEDQGTPPRRKRIRRRNLSSSSEEQLDQYREGQFQAAEAAEASKSDKLPVFQPSSGDEDD